MKRLIALVAVLMMWSTPAFAFSTTYSKSGTLEATKPFQSFGNFKVGDCQYETAANLILSHWPKSHISTAQVESAWSTYGDLGDATYPTTGLWVSQDFLLSTGFAGHHASSVTEIPTSQVLAAANQGGVEVVVLGPVRNHMFAIVSSKGRQITVIDDGIVTKTTLNALVYDQTISPGQQGEGLYFYAVRF